jgi:hypothetical protein
MKTLKLRTALSRLEYSTSWVAVEALKNNLFP